MSKLKSVLGRLRSSALRWLRYPVYSVQWAKAVRASRRAYRSPHHEPEWKAFHRSLPPIVRPFFDERWSKDRPSGSSTALFPKRTAEIVTDVIYAGTFKADAHKDLLALRQYRRDLHITAVLFSPVTDDNAFVTTLCDRVLFAPTQADYAHILLSATARALIFQGGDDQFPLLTSCLWQGRLVWQVRDTCLRAPRQYLDDLQYERAKFIAERADAIVSFHNERGWDNLAGIRFRSRPVCIPPLCVPALGPHRFRPKLSERDVTLHLVYAGGVGRRGGNPTGPIVHTHADFYEKFQSITKQGIHLHIYSPHLHKLMPGYEDYFALERTSPCFHIHHTLPFAQLLEELTQYDWGIMHVTWQAEYLLPGFDRPIQNGMMGHIQAGLPVIVSPTAYGNAEFVQRTGRGIVVDEADISRLRDILKQNRALLAHCKETPLEPAVLYDAEKFSRAVLSE